MSEPWNWYAGGPAPNPTPPFRLPGYDVGPAPPVGQGMEVPPPIPPVVMKEPAKQKKRKHAYP